MTITIAAEGNKAWLLDVDARQLNIRTIAATLVRHSRLCGWLAAEHGYTSDDLRLFFSRISRVFYSAWKNERVPEGLNCAKRYETQCQSGNLFARLIVGDTSVWDDYESSFMLIMAMFVTMPRFLHSTYSSFALCVIEAVFSGYRIYLKEHGLLTGDLQKQLIYQLQDAGREYDDFLYRRRQL